MATASIMKALKAGKLKGSWANRSDAKKALKKLGATSEEADNLLTADGKRWVLKAEACEVHAGVPLDAEGVCAECEKEAQAEIARNRAEAPKHDATIAELEGATITPKAKSAKTSKVAKTPKVAGEKRVTVTSVMEALILAGRTNAEVLVEAAKTFPQLAEDPKKYSGYAGWYRNRLKKAGKL